MPEETEWFMRGRSEASEDEVVGFHKLFQTTSESSTNVSCSVMMMLVPFVWCQHRAYGNMEAVVEVLLRVRVRV